LLRQLWILTRRLEELEQHQAKLGPDREVTPPTRSLVDAPESFLPVFETAQEYVTEYFSKWQQDPARARIDFSGERYILVRAASMSTQFFDMVTSLYRDRGTEEARSVALGFLFDLAHALGKADAASFHERMGVTDPLEKLSAGPVHFALAGWARVSILPESSPTPDENYFLTYDHPHSFEAEAWLERGERPTFPVCVMNGGYSSGWCEQSFGLPLVAHELTCRARGDSSCRFVMAPPSRIQEHLERLTATQGPGEVSRRDMLEVPEFFRRKRLEDELQRARNDLELRVVERTAELEMRNTELRQANRQLRELQEARAAFVATMSHELRTPLVTGLGYLELVLNGKLGSVSEEARGGMRVALRNLQRLSGLVDDILSYHRLTGRPEGPQPTWAAFDLGALCHECCEDFLVRTGWSRESVRRAIPEQPILVLADLEMIRRVIVNLLDNAERHGGAKTRIRFSVEPSADRANVSIADDGKGMSPEVLTRVLEPFAKFGSATEGLGLGLAIVKSLLESHDATLELASEEGRGTKASFSLPLSREAAESNPQEGAEPVPSPEGAADAPSAPSVLLVEDDADTAGFVELALGAEGYRIISVASGEEALERLGADTFDLMLVDLTLPGMNGTELCRRIKSDPRRSRIPIYLFTARAESSPREEAKAAGCDGYLVKPITVPALLTRIEEALSSKKKGA